MSNKKRRPAARADVPAPPPEKALPSISWRAPGIWILVLVVVAGVVAIVMTRDSDTSSPVADPETAFVEVVGTPLPEFEQPDAAVGASAPLINAETLDGERRVIGNDGVARVIGFFAHWCPHCQAEVPVAADWLRANTLPAGVEVVAISTAVDSSAGNYPPSDWLRREQWPTDVLRDDDANSVAEGYGLSGFPFWVALDSDGRVVARVAGSIGADQLAALVSAVTPVG